MSKQLRSLEALLRDPARTAFVAVTRPAELPRRETERLLAELDALSIPWPGCW
jgi:anion-transporting  ArsA/GET3 family ATPase